MIRPLLLALTCLLLTLAIACGGGDDDATPTPNLGLGASLPRHLASIAPANASLVTNAELTGEADGICATFRFGDGEGMGDDPTTLVKMTVQGEDVTDSATFVVTASAPPTGGTMCYAPPQALEIGPILTNVRWSDATGREFTYSWQFTVTG